MGRALEYCAGKGLAKQVAVVGAFLGADIDRVRTWWLPAHCMHAGGRHLNVLAISQETAKKTFRNGTATNITGTNEKDAFHKMRPREP